MAGQWMRERVRRNIYVFLTVLFAGAAVSAGSILVFRLSLPRDLPLSEDGFFEIYTTYDYERFWRRAKSQNFINGRLMADICLNDLSDFREWEVTPPVNQNLPVESFIGRFDGNGHSISGLYSENGYGLVERNRGQISDLTLKSSRIAGGASVSGICQRNEGQISGCVFQGELESTLRRPPAEGRIAGICGQNEGILWECGYRGTMTVRDGWRECGVRGGICAENRGQIVHCYNLTGMNLYTAAGCCYGIADREVKDSFQLKSSGWSLPQQERMQVTQIDRIWGRSIFFFRERGIGEWKKEEIVRLPACVRQMLAAGEVLEEIRGAAGNGGPGSRCHGVQEKDAPARTGERNEENKNRIWGGIVYFDAQTGEIITENTSHGSCRQERMENYADGDRVER